MLGVFSFAPPNRIVGVLSHLYIIGDMSRRKGDSTSRGYVKWNMLLSPHMSCQLQEEWAELLHLHDQ